MSSSALTNYILAVCTITRDSVGGSGPIFYCKDEEELQKTSLYLEKILDAMAHEVRPGVMILVKH
ncbi:capping complex subunit for YIEGIA [Tumebacillus permanentifrigoris]|uniref:Uncharacterized protein n=1 Tax=Tumebacillus permanentifrigoris TaxID=378543 RepID=A0A316DBK0_9BACL|nr:hypothetical protein [Tumebacillus permanentifrigoris]PWK14276.1 hypothetical protein C7459_10530 [Tumebacillus permanentifrigoris]